MDIYLDMKKVEDMARQALKEDIGPKDVTTSAVVPRGTNVRAHIIAKSEGVVCGLTVCEKVFSVLDADTGFKPLMKDGDRLHEGKVVAYVEGDAVHILSGERVALNYLGRLSGIATKTDELVKCAGSAKVKIMDTRKTTPGLRYLEKYAVRVGGGYSHRSGLWDQVLIKDNHLMIYKLSGSKPKLQELVKNTRKKIQQNIKLEIEVANLKEFEDALGGKPDIILLDNMSPEDIKKAVTLRNRIGKYPALEASGNIGIENIAEYANCGVERISIGALTQSVNAIDFSLQVDAKV